MLIFGRVLTAMVTPFGRDLQLDLTQAAVLAKRLVDAGIDGLLVAGMAGEGMLLSRQERLDLLREVVEAVGGGAAVVAGTGAWSIQENIAMAREAEKAGADGILLDVPCGFIPPREGLRRFIGEVARAVRLPVMLHNNPSRAGSCLDPETVRLLAELDNVKSLLDSEGNLPQAMACKAGVNREFALYAGDDLLTLPMMAIGAAGVVSTAAHLVGRRLKELVEAAAAGRMDLAGRLNQELMPLAQALSPAAGPALTKAALNLVGIRVGGVRPPLVEAEEKDLAALRVTLRRFGLL